MFFSTHPALARLVGRALQRIAPLAMVRNGEPVRFADMPARTGTVAVSTRSGPVPVTAYRPADTDGVPAVYVNLHGGGFTIGHPRQDDPWCRYLAATAGAVVLNVDYALAPQHPFPAAAHQAFDVVRWAAEAGAGQGWDGSRLAVGGQSAGASLAAAAARQALEAGGPSIALQVLNYGVFGMADGAGPFTGSGKPPLIVDLAIGNYLPDPAQRRHRMASPLQSTPAELTGIAPALVVAAGRDRLRPQSEAYADLLRGAGALQELIVVPDADHAYDVLGRDDRLTREVYAVVSGRVRDALAR